MQVVSCDVGPHLHEHKGVENQRPDLSRLISPCGIHLLAYLCRI